MLRVEGARSQLHMGQAGYISTTHWSLLHSTLSIAIHFNGSNGTAYIRPPSVCYKYYFYTWKIQYSSHCPYRIRSTSLFAPTVVGGGDMHSPEISSTFKDYITIITITSATGLLQQFYTSWQIPDNQYGPDCIIKILLNYIFQ